MRLTRRILDAISEMSAMVEAGSVPDQGDGSNSDENAALYWASVDAGQWARLLRRKRGYPQT